jgi:hypothetical protein
MRKFLLVLVVAFLVPQVQARATEPVREWTFLVFLNGNNNLDSYGPKNIMEMEQTGSSDNLNIVVQWASLAGGTHRVFVKKSTDPTKVTSPIVDEPGNVDMGDWRNLVEFVRWGVAHYPARHYFINVWDHGSGWHLKALDGMFRPKDISWDEKTGNHITTEQLAQAMGEAARIIGHKVDLYGSDACLMGSAEVADEMAESVEYYVGSEEVEPLDGWPYGPLMAFWAPQKRTAPEIAATLVTEYVKSYQNGVHGSSQVTMSAYDLKHFGHFNTAVAALGKELRKLDKDARAKVLGGASNAQRFAYSDYADLGDMLDKIEGTGVDSRALADVRNASGHFVIANAATENYAHAKGVSIWMPTSKSSYNWYSARYKGLRFNAHTSWGDTLAYLLQDDTSSLASQ